MLNEVFEIVENGEAGQVIRDLGAVLNQIGYAGIGFEESLPRELLYDYLYNVLNLRRRDETLSYLRIHQADIIASITEKVMPPYVLQQQQVPKWS